MKNLFKKCIPFWIWGKIQKGSLYPLWARFLVAWKIKKLHLEYSLPLPRIMDIEITNICNAHCIMCPQKKSGRQRGSMDRTLYERLIDECVELRINDIRLNIYGEPLMDNDIGEKIRYAKDKGIKNVSFFTNASLLTEQKAREIIGSGLDEIYISLDGASRETFESIRKGLNYEVVLNNIENLLKIRGSVLKVYLFFTCLPENIKEIRLFRRIWESKVDGINIGRAREIDNLNPLSRKQLAPCPYLWQRMFVLWNGDVVACCSDSDAKLVIGNVWASGIYGVWKSSKFEQIRKLHLSYQSNNIVLCNNCQLNLWLRWIVYFRF